MTSRHSAESSLVNPSTKISLLMRIKDRDDSQAWGQFVDIYGPLIYHFGRRKGLQDADATDFVQDVMQQIAQHISKFEYDPKLGKFRSYLYVIAKHALARSSKKAKRQPTGSGESAVGQMLQQIPSSIDDDEIWETEYRQHLFSWACEKVQSQFSDSTWTAFIRTAVDGAKASEVAEQLGISVGAVYIARSRVTQKLKDVIATVDESL